MSETDNKAERKQARREFVDRIAYEIDTGHSKALLIANMKEKGFGEADVSRAIATLQSQKRVRVDNDWLTLISGSDALDWSNK